RYFSAVLLSSCHTFCNAPITTDIYTLSLHDALPICRGLRGRAEDHQRAPAAQRRDLGWEHLRLDHLVVQVPGAGELSHALGDALARDGHDTGLPVPGVVDPALQHGRTRGRPQPGRVAA